MNALAAFVFYIAIIIGLAVGYVMNIVALCHATELSGMVVARAIGLFAFPLGAVLGYF